MAVRACANFHELDACADGVDGEVNVLRDVARFDEGIERGEERARDGLELGVGVGKRGLERIDVGEKGSEVVDGEDEVLVVSLAHFFDLRLFGPCEVAEVVVECFWLAGGEGLANEGTEVLVVADGRGEEELVELVAGVVAVGRNDFPARRFGGEHRRWRWCARGRRRKFRDSEN